MGSKEILGRMKSSRREKRAVSKDIGQGGSQSKIQGLGSISGTGSLPGKLYL